MPDEGTSQPRPAPAPEVWPYHPAPQGARARRGPPPAPPAKPADAARHPWGIALSGGGIRSASFCLGALQAMQRRAMLCGDEDQRATYLSAVSGGSYIAGAYALLARQLQPVPGDAGGLPDPPMADVAPYARPLAPGGGEHHRPKDGHPPSTPTAPPISPEELYLADHALYMTHGPGGPSGALWHLVLGILVNLGLLGLAIDALARPLGWAAGRIYPSLRFSASTHGVHTASWAWITLGAGAGAAVLVGVISIVRPWNAWTTRAEAASRALVLLTVAWAALIVLPYILAGLNWLLTPAVSTHTVRQSAARLKVATGVGSGMSLAIALAQVRRIWAHKPKVPESITKGVRGFLSSHRSAVLNVAAAIAGPLMVLGAFLLLLTSAAGSAARGGAAWRTDLIWWLVALAGLCLIWIFADLNAWSIHSFYFKRLGSAFAIGRARADHPDPRLEGDFDPSAMVVWPPGPDAVPVGTLPWKLTDPELSLTRFQAQHFPEVLICACANVTQYGAIPTGLNATSFVFSGAQVGGPLVGAVPSAEYQEALGGLAINLPEAVSVSGAAVSPEMGKMTRAPLRFLMTVANVRLGVWIINPRRLASGGKGRRRPPFPRPTYLLRELLGRNNLDAAYLYVTDGGHYENLGLVEQLRREAQWVFCIDAAGDQVDTFHTLGEAIGLARSELGVDIVINPDKDMALVADPHPHGPKHAPWVRQGFCLGTIHYPGRAEPGRLVYVKAAVTPDAPWDVRNYSMEHPVFPTDPTLDQLYDAERVEAYRALGEFLTEQALVSCQKEFQAWKDARHPVPPG